MDKITQLVKEQKLNEGQLQNLFRLRRMELLRERMQNDNS